ncbi:MATE family efflux transporter [Aquibium microcysteis]|uniref:MATE family efflux transporter n=1 Tax=Aquibium microcysteis TaxID=675281 RepID=UPI00165D2B7C|nr:MATE family efflux transporter [Aquibium microcysteis]
MTDTATRRDNPFLVRPLPGLFLRTAAPIVFIMGMNGLLTVVDAYFLGTFVGADALTAVTLLFPVYMLLVALSTVVASGLASVLARLLGAGDHAAARRAYVAAHALALVLCAAVIAAFLAVGGPLTLWVANGSVPLAAMGHTYIAILVFAAPVSFFLGLNADALRCEGRMGLMAATSLVATLANVVFNYLLIVVFDFGVAGSAWGTVMAQTLALAAVLVFRFAGDTPIPLASLRLDGFNRDWPRFLALGAPQSLSFVGIACASAAIIAMLQLWATDTYAQTVAAYGVMTRILTFAFLPLMGLNMAVQTITGNNFGGGLFHRSDASLRLGGAIALVYCASMQAVFFTQGAGLGQLFVDDPATIAEIARILPIATMAYVLAGPILVLAGYFQAIGDAGRAAVLSITRTYAFAIPLTFALPALLGEGGIWLAGPASEVLMLGVVAVLLAQSRARTGLRWGVFRASAEGFENAAPAASMPQA